MIPLSGFFAGLMAIVHLFAGKLRFLDVIPRSRWLSMAGGVSVSYVFVHIFPDLSRAQETLRRTQALGTRFLEYHVYLVALLGLVIFYGLERLVTGSKKKQAEAKKEELPSPGVFWIHIGSFAMYNALVGYLLLHREVPGIRSLTLFGIAMALHFVVNDFGLRKDHKQNYHRIGRWILAVAVIMGWMIGSAIALHPATAAILFAFLAGGVILNVLKEELPAERESRFGSFALGMMLYTALLLIK